MPEKVIQIIQSTQAPYYFLYLTSDGDVWRTLDPASDEWELLPKPMGKPTKDLFKKKLHHASGT